MSEVGYETFRDAVLRIHPGAEEKDIKAAYTLAEGQKNILSAVLKRLKELKKEREELGLVEVIPKVILTTITAQLVKKGLKKMERKEGGEEKDKKEKEEEKGIGESESDKDKIKELIKDVQNYVKKIIRSKRACYLASIYAKKKLNDYNPAVVFGDVYKDGVKVRNHAWLIITVKGKKWIYDPTIKKFVEELPILIPLDEGKKYWKVRGLLEELKREKGGREGGGEGEEGGEQERVGSGVREKERGIGEAEGEEKAAILWL